VYKDSIDRFPVNGIFFFKTIVFVFSLLIVIHITTQPAKASLLFQASLTNAASTGSPSPTRFTNTPAQSPTPSETPTITPTTTLIPLPAITLVFPAKTSTPTATITPVAASVTTTPQSSSTNGNSPLSPRYILLEVLVGCLWVILFIFAIAFIHQFR
jgi:hypothetical protein